MYIFGLYALPDTCNPVSHLMLGDTFSRPFACFLLLLALLLEGPIRQTESPSRDMRLALRSIVDTHSFLLDVLIPVLPDSLRDPTAALRQYCTVNDRTGYIEQKSVCISSYTYTAL